VSVEVGCILPLLASGVPAGTILVIVPQRSLATPYYEALCHPDLARRMVDLFSGARHLASAWHLKKSESGSRISSVGR
jgi:hypothetical protein